MEFLAGVGLIAIIAIILILILRKHEDNNNEINHLRNLAAQDGGLEFDEFLKKHRGLSYERALREYYKDPKKLAEAEENKKRRDENNRKFEELQKKENTINRVYAYKYEDFIFSLFSPFASYTSYNNEWRIPHDSLPENYVVHRMKEISSEHTYSLFREFLKKGLLYRHYKTTKISIGGTLSFYANIISEEDMNMDKWIKKNGQSQSKEELLADVDAFEESLY
jgi:hypothetical protein